MAYKFQMSKTIPLLVLFICSSLNSATLNFKYREKHSNKLISNEIVVLLIEDSENKRTSVEKSLAEINAQLEEKEKVLIDTKLEMEINAIPLG